MVAPDLQDRLKRVIVRRSNALNLVDVAILRVLTQVGSLRNAGPSGVLIKHARCRAAQIGLVDVQETEQPASLAAHIPDLNVPPHPRSRKLTSRPFGAVTSHDVLSGFLLGSIGEWKADIA
jgi:hypothetical protein